ncbi:MAG TPA: hypothetical protein DEA96_05285 [Leptospiraceae bacterium]|nr:hypothetical protein [Spirochaetaceae bacterium]HBS04355.1 hypothetical protein [Leptospiraceae bacterium]
MILKLFESDNEVRAKSYIPHIDVVKEAMGYKSSSALDRESQNWIISNDGAKVRVFGVVRTGRNERLHELDCETLDEALDFIINFDYQFPPDSKATKNAGKQKVAVLDTAPDLLKNHTSSAFLGELAEQGFYKYTSTEKLVSVQQSFAETGNLFSEETGRLFMMDAEELGEDGIGPFIEEVKPFFTRLGLSLILEDHTSDEGYSFRLNGKRYKCWSEDQAEESGIRTIVALGKGINQVLEAAGSDERMYGLYAGGNDGFAVFLTKEQFRTIRATDELEESEKPAELTLKNLR